MESMCGEVCAQKRMTAAILDLSPPDNLRAEFISRMINTLVVLGFKEYSVVRKGDSINPIRFRGWIFILCDGATDIAKEMKILERRQSAHLIFVTSAKRSAEEWQATARTMALKQEQSEWLQIQEWGGWTEGSRIALNGIIARTIANHQNLYRGLSERRRAQRRLSTKAQVAA